MSIGDMTLKTWQNGVDAANAANFQRFENKLYELDKYGIPRFILKTSDEVVNNSSTLQNDNQLVAVLEPLKFFEIELHLCYRGSSSSDIKVAWTYSGTIDDKSNRYVAGSSYTDASASNDINSNYTCRGLTTANAFSANFSVASNSLIEKFLVDTGASGGTLQLQWAQNTAVAENTTVETGSYLKITEMQEF